MRLAAVLALVAVAAFAVNFIGATGGHCDDSGCSAGFPRWLYEVSGWLVLASVAGLACVAVAALVRRLRRS